MLIALGVVVVIVTTTTPTKPLRRPGPSVSTATNELPAVEAGVLAWRLPAPISREVALPGRAPGSILLAGGLSADGSSDAGTYTLDTDNGHLTALGSLGIATHDAAGAVVRSGALVVGGGSVAPGASVQSVAADGSSSLLGRLPEARADAAAVTLGTVAYIVGGYDGPSLDPEVLATTDGVNFTPVARLRVPVRYPAVAALDGRIYVFGGQAGDGRAVATEQVVDPRTGTTKVIGDMPIPLSGAVAATLHGTIYLAGGTTAPNASGAVRDIFAFDMAHLSLMSAGSLAIGVANAGATVISHRLYIVGGETSASAPTADVQMLTPDTAFGIAGRRGAGSPFYGDELLIADRGNDRLLLVDDTGRILWRYPSKHAAPPPGGFYFPDDAFFIRHGTAIISNQEENDTVVEIAYPSGRLLFSYGHPRTPGSTPGYLDSPDDAYLLRNGDITVADPLNCRVVVIDPTTKAIVHEIGMPGTCAHRPPNDLGSPNGDTPLADGNLLVSEIDGSWIDEYTPRGRLVWDVKLAIGYPSDAQQIGPDRYLVADYEHPGAIVEFDRSGRILYRYQPTSGPGELDKPSLVEMLPSGVFLLNDDYDNRIIAIDPVTGALVWQYGSGLVGTTPGLLNTPDGFDILAPGGSTPTHAVTG